MTAVQINIAMCGRKDRTGPVVIPIYEDCSTSMSADAPLTKPRVREDVKMSRANLLTPPHSSQEQRNPPPKKTKKYCVT